MASYEVELSDKAAESLQSYPVDVVVCISNHLTELAGDPLALGRRAHFPYRPVGQIYDFWCHEAAGHYFVTVFFHFKPGEQTIKVYAISVREIPEVGMEGGPDNGDDAA